MKIAGKLLWGVSLIPALLMAGSADPAPYLIVLGIAQDGGIPQLGTKHHPGWEDPSQARLVVSLGLVDPASSQRWLFEATPDLKRQLHRLDEAAPSTAVPGLDGIFLTHAHIGHYLGLALLGHESLGAEEVPLYVMPRFAAFLKNNGPWDQLVRYRNIDLRVLEQDKSLRLNGRLSVTPILVPHRQEYSEVVGFRIQGPETSAFFLPDIDSWAEWDAQGVHLEDILRSVDYAYLDGSFFADGEVPGRDMSAFPHPRMVETMKRLADLPASERAKVRFIHLNRTNPAVMSDSAQARRVRRAGFRIAAEGERIGL